MQSIPPPSINNVPVYSFVIFCDVFSGNFDMSPGFYKIFLHFVNC